MQETAEEAEEREKVWEEKAEKRKLFEKTFKYRFYSRLLRFLSRLHHWAANKTTFTEP